MVGGERVDIPIKTGFPAGIIAQATIKKDNGDGTVYVKLNRGDQGQTTTWENVNLPMAWCGPQGQFMGGAAIEGSTVLVSKGIGGSWYIIGYIKSQNTFDYSYGGQANSNRLSELYGGRLLLQTDKTNTLILDPNDGTIVGNSKNNLQINPIKKIISHNYEGSWGFTEASRKVNDLVKRDVIENSDRNVGTNTLVDQNYDESLTVICMDPSSSYALETTGDQVRNLGLAEQRELTYEFAHSGKFTNDREEEKKYLDPDAQETQLKVSRREMRPDAFSLSQEYPNHLIETVKGTAVDTFGNILSINRFPLPIGQTDSLSLNKTSTLDQTFVKIREQLRKSIAFHFEINARKTPEDTIPPADTVTDYDRRLSQFFLDVDKEGQFKLNVPASSEVGNVPLNVRYTNFSNLYARDENNKITADSFIRPEDNQDILLNQINPYNPDGYSITLQSGDKSLGGLEVPVDRITDLPITYGTTFHDITQVCKFLTTESPRLPDTKQVHPYTDKENRLNNIEHFDPYEPIVSRIITVSGDKADAGGRSGSVNLDGFCAVNIGANTIDRQSLWLDCAGGIVSTIGKDKQGISYAAALDGDFIMQVGGTGLGSTADSRFDDQNPIKDGVVDIRVIANNGQQMIFRMSSKGIDIFSAGGLNITAQSNINIKTNGTLGLDAENIKLFNVDDNGKGKLVTRHGAQTI